MALAVTARPAGPRDGLVLPSTAMPMAWQPDVASVAVATTGPPGLSRKVSVTDCPSSIGQLYRPGGNGFCASMSAASWPAMALLLMVAGAGGRLPCAFRPRFSLSVTTPAEAGIGPAGAVRTAG